MGKFMRFGVAVAVVLCAAGAFASNFRVADQVYVPIAGHTVGNGRLFVTDAFVSNLSSDSVDVSVMFIDFSGNITQFKPNQNGYVFTLTPGERREMIDFVGLPKAQGGLALSSAIGQLVFNGCKANQDCTPDATSGENPNFRNISVETRIYSVDAAASGSPQTLPSNGQLFAGLPWYSYVSTNSSAAGLDKVFVTGLRNNGGAGTVGTYRTNIGLVNASQFSTTTLLIKLFDGKTGAQIGSDVQRQLGPLTPFQAGIASLFPSFTGATATNAYVTVEQIPTATQPTSDATANGCSDGCPAFFAYGSLLDNATGDAITLEAQYLKAWTLDQVQCIYNLTCKGGTYKPHRAAKK
jgi:hypothetical protein